MMSKYGHHADFILSNCTFIDNSESKYVNNCKNNGSRHVFKTKVWTINGQISGSFPNNISFGLRAMKL